MYTLNSMSCKLKMQKKRIRVSHKTKKVDQAEWGEMGTHINPSLPNCKIGLYGPPLALYLPQTKP